MPSEETRWKNLLDSFLYIHTLSGIIMQTADELSSDLPTDLQAQNTGKSMYIILLY